jgi:hypothetical protein
MKIEVLLSTGNITGGTKEVFNWLGGNSPLLGRGEVAMEACSRK